MRNDFFPPHPESRSTIYGYEDTNPQYAGLLKVGYTTVDYEKGEVGDVEVKKRLAHVLDAFLDPIRTRREAAAKEADAIDDILMDGTRRARTVAEETMTRSARR